MNKATETKIVPENVIISKIYHQGSKSDAG